MSDRRRWTERATDAVLSWWLTGTHDPDMAAWWETQEAVDTAHELVHVVRQAIEEAGFEVRRIVEADDG